MHLKQVELAREVISVMIDHNFCHGWFGDRSDEFREERKAEIKTLYHAMMTIKHSIYNIGNYCARPDLLISILQSIRDDRTIIEFSDREYIDITIVLLKAGEFNLAERMFQDKVLPAVHYS